MNQILTLEVNVEDAGGINEKKSPFDQNVCCISIYLYIYLNSDLISKHIYFHPRNPIQIKFDPIGMVCRIGLICCESFP